MNEYTLYLMIKNGVKTFKDIFIGSLNLKKYNIFKKHGSFIKVTIHELNVFKSSRGKQAA